MLPHQVGDMVRSRRSSWMLLRSKDSPAVTRFWSCGLGAGLGGGGGGVGGARTAGALTPGSMEEAARQAGGREEEDAREAAGEGAGSSGASDEGSGMRPGLRLFLLKPETGRTHQLRVAMKSERRRLLGDVQWQIDVADRRSLHHAIIYNTVLWAMFPT